MYYNCNLNLALIVLLKKPKAIQQKNTIDYDIDTTCKEEKF
jgi:hypothetical protein